MSRRQSTLDCTRSSVAKCARDLVTRVARQAFSFAVVFARLSGGEVRDGGVEKKDSLVFSGGGTHTEGAHTDLTGKLTFITFGN